MAATHRRQSVSGLLFKPYGYLSQFTPPGGSTTKWKTLSSLGTIPPGVYPAGRLDADSEGLLFLTGDGELVHRLLDASFRHPRTYLVQVERVPDSGALEKLRNGGIVLDGRSCLPADVQILQTDPDLPPRDVSIRFRKSVPTCWLEFTLVEGRNRQVRRMTAAAGFPTLRLVRTRIGPLTTAGLAPGSWRALSKGEVLDLRTSLGLQP